MVKKIESLEEWKAILESAGVKLIVLDFTADWCGPCKNIAPVFEDLAAKHQDVLFYKVDVDEAADLAESCGIRSMPTFQFYKAGKKIFEFSGADSKKLCENVEKHK